MPAATAVHVTKPKFSIWGFGLPLRVGQSDRVQQNDDEGVPASPCLALVEEQLDRKMPLHSVMTAAA